MFTSKTYRMAFALLMMTAILAMGATAMAADYVPVMVFGSNGTGNGQFSQPEGIVLDSSGNIYVTDYNNNRVQKFSSAGVYLSQFGSSGTADGQFHFPEGIVLDASGNIHIADNYNHRVQKFSSTGVYLSQFGSSGIGNGQFSYPGWIAIDSAGDIYVTDNSNHRVQKFSSAGIYLSQFGSSGIGNGQFSYPEGIAIDAADNIWVVDYGNRRVQKFSSSGVYLSQFGSSGTGDGQFSFPIGIALDSAGNIFVVDGGAASARVQKFGSAGIYLSQFGSYGAGIGQFNAPNGITVDSSGNVYVVDVGNNRIQKWAPISRIINLTGDLAFGDVQIGATKTATLTISNTGNSDLTVSSIVYPTSGGFTGDWSGGTIAPGASRNVTVTFAPTAVQTYGGTITVISNMTSGTNTTSASGAGVATTRIINMPRGLSFGNIAVGTTKTLNFTISNTGNSDLTVSSMSYPTGFTGDWSGGIIAAGGSQSVTLTFTPTAAQQYIGTVKAVSDSNTFFGNSDMSISGGGITTSSDAEYYRLVLSFGSSGIGDGQFDIPYSITTDSSDNIFVADSLNNRVQKFNNAGVFISQFGTIGANRPSGIAIDSSGNIFVADSGNNRIQKFSSTGSVISTFGSIGTGDGQFTNPKGVAIDSSGNIFVADNNNNRIQKFDSSGVFISKFGSLGTGDGQFNQPPSLAIDGVGNIYVADAGNSRIQKFDNNGVFISKFGTQGTGDGQLYYPNGVAVDSFGNIFVSDLNNNRVQKFDGAGVYQTQFGTSGTGIGQFNRPAGITVDNSGNVYVSDTYNNRLQKWTTVKLTGDLAFGNVQAGLTKQSSFTIINTGASPLTVGSITYPTGFTGDWSSGTIPTGGSQNISVTFAPSAVQSYLGVVAITLDNGFVIDRIAASGNGIDTATLYTWTGNSTNTIKNRWDDPQNWSSSSGTAGVPGSFDSVIIPGSVTSGRWPVIGNDKVLTIANLTIEQRTDPDTGVVPEPSLSAGPGSIVQLTITDSLKNNGTISLRPFSRLNVNGSFINGDTAATGRPALIDVQSGAVLSITGTDLQNKQYGLIHGRGTINVTPTTAYPSASFINDGRVEPGALYLESPLPTSPPYFFSGTLTINGTFTQHAGMLLVDVRPSDSSLWDVATANLHNYLTVNGAAYVGGNLIFRYRDYVPAGSYDVVQTSSGNLNPSSWVAIQNVPGASQELLPAAGTAKNTLRINVPCSTYKWSGASSNEWTNSANWLGTPPSYPNSSSVSVFIPNTTNQPQISSVVDICGITMENGSSLNVKSGGGTLTIHNGGYYMNSGITVDGTLNLLGGNHYFKPDFSFSGSGKLTFGQTGTSDYPTIYAKGNLNINVPLSWIGGVVEPDGTNNFTMTLAKNSEIIGSDAFKKLYGMDIIIPGGGVMSLKDGEFYLGNAANFKIEEGGILSVDGVMSIYNFNDDKISTFENKGTIAGNGTLDFATSDPDYPVPVVFTNNGTISPGSYNSSTGISDIGTLTIQHPGSIQIGTLAIQINSAATGGYDVLSILGTAALGGTLNVTAYPTYVPNSTDYFDVLKYSLTRSGTFASVSQSWNAEYADSEKVVRLRPQAATYYTLTISVNPSGSGSVSVSGGTVVSRSSCSSSCSYTFPAGSQISLYATPNSGNTFLYWSGASGSSSYPQEAFVTMDGNKSVTAYFSYYSPPDPYIPPDYCPEDPNKTEPGKCGCGVPDTDSDGDGTPDCADACSSDPNKTAPGKCGCGKPETGNCAEDKCPNDPSKTEPGICGCGVADTDSDGDGTPDCADACSSDPNKTAPGKCGCGIADTDSDGDGTPDCADACSSDPNKTAPGKCGCGKPETENCIEDKCPNDPAKTDPGICGCGVPDTDSDGDGTPDCNDQCPSDPKKTAPGICGCGIPDTDADGDGITDCRNVPAPKPPTLMLPKLLDVIPQLPVMLQAGPFASEGTQHHLETHWLIQRTDRLYIPGINGLFDDKTDISETSSDLTKHAFADAAAGLKYTWKAGYKGSGSSQIAWSELSSFIVGILQKITPTEVKPGTEIMNYQMISFPYWTQSEKLEDMIGHLIGQYDRRMFRIGTYDPVRGGYAEYGEGLELRPGKAYWILSRNGIRISFDGVPVSLNYAIEMKPDQGWNMIAPPNDASYDWNKVEVLVYDDTGKVVYSGLISDAASQEYIDSSVWLWVGSEGSYAPTTTLSRDTGSWVRVKKSSVVIRFPESARLNTFTAVVRNAQEQTLRFAGSLFTPKQAIATSAETPPMPMGNTGFTVDSDGVDAGGGCFIDSAAQ